MDKLDHPLIKLQCYEPAGNCITISERDLLGHTLIVGSTGAGKTTRVINPMLKQLVEHNASDQKSKTGLCILDTKADGECLSLMKRLCHEAGRSQDLIVISDTSEQTIDLLGPIRRHGLSGIDAVSDILSQLIADCEANRYWEITMASLVRQVLRLMLFSRKPLEFSQFVSLVTEYLLRYRVSQWTTDVIDELKQSDAEDFDHSTNLAINETLATHRMWTTLESRTRSILQSMAAPIAEALSSQHAELLLGSEGTVDIEEACTGGKIIIICIDAIRHSQLAPLVAAVAKSRFYDAILERNHSASSDHRIAGLILDDWPLCATGGIDRRYSDVSALSMLRSRRGFMVSATQSLAALDIKMGTRSRAATVANFSNLFFLRSRDLDTDAFAAAYMGEKRRVNVDRTIHDRPPSAGRKQYPIRFERETFVPAVPIGSLSRLPLGECYALIGAEVYAQPLCLVPEYALHQPLEEDHEPTH